MILLQALFNVTAVSAGIVYSWTERTTVMKFNEFRKLSLQFSKKLNVFYVFSTSGFYSNPEEISRSDGSKINYKRVFFYILLTVHLSVFILVINQFDAQNLFYNKFISCLNMFRAQCAHRQEVKIVLYSLWYHETYRWPSGARDGHL